MTQEKHSDLIFSIADDGRPSSVLLGDTLELTFKGNREEQWNTDTAYTISVLYDQLGENRSDILTILDHEYHEGRIDSLMALFNFLDHGESYWDIYRRDDHRALEELGVKIFHDIYRNAPGSDGNTAVADVLLDSLWSLVDWWHFIDINVWGTACDVFQGKDGTYYVKYDAWQY